MAGYCNLNHFKPHNDQYGYFHGDHMIQLVAGILVKHAEPRGDFVNHVGGGDFVVLFQSDDWARRCQDMIREMRPTGCCSMPVIWPVACWRVKIGPAATLPSR